MKLRIWAALIAVYVVWGSTYLAIRYAVETIPPFLMAGSRFIISGLILYVWRRMAGDPGPRPVEWKSAAIVGLFLLLGGNGLVSWAEQSVPSGVTSLLVGGAPLWMVLIDAIRPGGIRPNGRTVAGVLIGFAGITVLVGPSSWSGPQLDFDIAGVIALLAAAIFWAIGSLYSRNAALPASSLLGTGMEMLAGGAGLVFVGTVLGEWAYLDVGAISVESLLGLTYLILFGSLVGFVSYTWLLRNAPTPLVSTYAYVNPLIAILLGSLIAREPLTLRILLASAVILSAVGLINTARSNAPSQAVHMPVPSVAGKD
jgi:drug/metabolite transporter (DMT)-like permease